MLTFSELCDAFIASLGEHADQATITRVTYWRDLLGGKPCDAITPDDIFDGLAALKKRGKLKTGVATSEQTGQKLKGSTMNRYLNQCGSLFVFAKDELILRGGFISPTLGIKRFKEEEDSERYIRDDEVERILACAPLVDRTWRKMRALITTAMHTGLRVGNILDVKGKDLDLKSGTLTVYKTKTGKPITAALSDDCIDELKKLPKVSPEARVFGNADGGRFHYRQVWLRILAKAKVKHHAFHELRHSHGYALARKGTTQQMIMASMGHATLTASRRYAHAHIDDKRATIAHVFPRRNAVSA